jgi:hypothetical protein
MNGVMRSLLRSKRIAKYRNTNYRFGNATSSNMPPPTCPTTNHSEVNVMVHPDWRERVVKEKTDLDHNLDALLAFLMGPDIASIPPAQKHLLRIQADAMQTYSDVLGARLAAPTTY